MSNSIPCFHIMMFCFVGKADYCLYAGLCINEAAREGKRTPHLRGVLFCARNHILDESYSHCFERDISHRAGLHLALILMLWQMK